MISVVIPVYNVSPFLRECLNSVLSQTYASWEALCVDDGSTDGGGKILDEYASKDKRFTVIHQENAGVSAARNAALRIATGNWIFFLDGDDFLDCKALESIAEAQHKGADMILIKYRLVASRDELKKPALNGIAVKELGKICWDEYFHPLFGVAYKREHIEGMQFEPLTIGEDRVWVLNALTRARKIAMLDYEGYGYREREGSAIHSKMTARKFRDNLSHFAIICKIFAREPERFEPAVIRRLGQSLTEYTSMEYIALPKADRREMFAYWMDVMRDCSELKFLKVHHRIILKICSITRLESVALVLCYVSFWLKSHGFHRPVRTD